VAEVVLNLPITKHIILLNHLTLVAGARLGYKGDVGANHLQLMQQQQEGKTGGRFQTIMINNRNTSITTVIPGKSKTLTL
jgi:hypothetical protein